MNVLDSEVPDMDFVLGKNADGEFSLKHNFYGMKVLLTNNDPDMFGLYTMDGDKLYVKRSSLQNQSR